MVVKNTDGNVGIGTTAPNAKLALGPTIGAKILAYDNNNNIFAGLGIDVAGGNSFDVMAHNGGFITFGKTGNTVGTMTSGYAEWMRITNTGNVGIGTTSPSHKLEVAGSMNISGDLNVSGNLKVSGTSYLGSITINANKVTTAELNVTDNMTVGNVTIMDNSLFQPVYGTDDGLVLYLPFSEGNASMGSTKVYDRSPYGNDGVCNGVAAAYGCNWTTGKYGNALQFDGVNDYVDAGNDASQDMTEQLTLEAWMKTSDINGDIITKASCFSGSYQAYALYIDSNGKLTLFLNSLGQGGSLDWNLNGNTAVNDNQWHHVVGTWNEKGGTNNAKVYIDGKQDAQNTVPVGGITTNTEPLSIGGGASSCNWFNAIIDEVRVYNRALTPDEIRTHYLRGSGFGASGAITADKFRVVNTSGSKIFEVNQTMVKIAPGGVDRMTIDSSGNVGIGTTGPGAVLQINSVSSTDWVPMITVLNPNMANGNHAGRIAFGTAESDSKTGSISYVTSATSLQDYISLSTYNHADLMVIKSSGNVGIGTTLPARALDVNGQVIINSTAPEFDLYNRNGGTDEKWWRIVAGEASESSLEYKLVNDAATASTNYMVVGRSGTTVTNVSFPNGNIGIGTTAPGALLHVSGDGVFTGTSSAKVIDLYSAGGYRIGFDNVGATKGYIRYNIVANTAADTWGHALGHSLAATPNTLVTDMFVSATGNVGIGTTSPGSTLTVAGAINTTSGLIVGGSNSASIFDGNPGDEVSITFRQNAGSTFYSGIGMYTAGGANAGLSLWAGNSGVRSPHLYIRNSGNVGIGTTSPGTLLHLSSSSPLITINDTDTPQYFTVGGAGDDFGIYLNGTNTKGITIDQDGYVGIGTAAPSANGKLTIAGNVVFPTDLTAYQISGHNSGGAIQIQASGGTVDRWLKLGKIDNNNLFTPVLTIGDNTNVGIGTTSPSKQLVVNGTTEGIMFEPNVASPVINTTTSASNSNLTITSSSGSVIIRLG